MEATSNYECTSPTHGGLKFARWLKTLSGLTPYEYIANIWTSEPDRIIVDLINQMPGLNT
jgi:hypothetical protein